MGYIQDFEVRLRVMLEGQLPEPLLEEALKVMKETIIESYKNGLQHGRLSQKQDKPASGRKPAWTKRK